MKFVRQENEIIMRIERGEKVVESIKELCITEKIEGGFFYGLGAVDWVEVAHYNVPNKKYRSQEFEQAFEVTNLTGSIGVFASEVVVHVHITLSDTEMNAFGGHVVEAIVSGTMEILLTPLSRLQKISDDSIGLKIFDL
ncbi:DNA-binding protein [candidate division WWE3 bacterium CG22_combo_CG10-13_8_21_14_all_39_12]|uniref:DNA-binding protein n=1 Tax=candidate division WWE3 bacterium CG22_combo_CG10-13_8_21_14_all_39_12 TaxID=1975094 RepID=A0A2H0BF95_UNCKA|nr:MAG: DNA-binding protein [candidate division WWE3 bacterium CG22_combo_CG10-13_8_21_14_all_39_12]